MLCCHHANTFFQEFWPQRQAPSDCLLTLIFRTSVFHVNYLKDNCIRLNYNSLGNCGCFIQATSLSEWNVWLHCGSPHRSSACLQRPHSPVYPANKWAHLWCGACERPVNYLLKNLLFLSHHSPSASTWHLHKSSLHV